MALLILLTLGVPSPAERDAKSRPLQPVPRPPRCRRRHLRLRPLVLRCIPRDDVQECTSSNIVTGREIRQYQPNAVVLLQRPATLGRNVQLSFFTLPLNLLLYMHPAISRRLIGTVGCKASDSAHGLSPRCRWRRAPHRSRDQIRVSNVLKTFASVVALLLTCGWSMARPDSTLQPSCRRCWYCRALNLSLLTAGGGDRWARLGVCGHNHGLLLRSSSRRRARRRRGENASDGSTLPAEDEVKYVYVVYERVYVFRLCFSAPAPLPCGAQSTHLPFTIHDCSASAVHTVKGPDIGPSRRPFATPSGRIPRHQPHASEADRGRNNRETIPLGCQDLLFISTSLRS